MIQNQNGDVGILSFVYQSFGLLGNTANQAGQPLSHTLHLSELEKDTHSSKKTELRPRHLV